MCPRCRMVTQPAPAATVRRAYARQLMLAARIEDQRLEQAFAKVPREAFLGPGPWAIIRPPDGYETTPDADPVRLYQDVLVGIIPEKGLNNGQPSFLALLISLGRPREGDRVIHIGAGPGYYTAIIAEMVGRAGQVIAVEYEQELAIRAAANLSPYASVRVIHGDGSAMTFEPSDIIYVNAGAVRPENVWLDALKDGGRLVLPLTARCITDAGHTMTMGAVFLIERQGQDYLAHWKSGAAIYPCMGTGDAVSEAALAKAFDKGGWENVTHLYRTDKTDDQQCWVRGPGWSLA